jgi:hypothetical protein
MIVMERFRGVSLMLGVWMIGIRELDGIGLVRPETRGGGDIVLFDFVHVVGFALDTGSWTFCIWHSM